MKYIYTYLEEHNLQDLLKKASLSRVERALTYRNEDDQKKCLLGEDLLRQALISQNLPIKEILIDKNGKPYVDIESFYFNISHSSNMVALACSDREIGIDIEKIKERDIAIQKYFSEDEQEYISKSEDKLLAFYRIWTLKESYLKMLGLGLLIPLDSFTILPNVKFNGAKFEQWLQDDFIITICIKELV